jgi:ATP-binding cassette subfamily F protein uup
LTYAERLELERLPEAIDVAEAALAALEAELADPTLYKRGGEVVAERTAAAEQARAEVEGLTARWEALEAKQEE